MRNCRCGNKSGITYVPELSSKLCCSDCFSEIIESKKEIVKSVVKFKEFEDSYCAVKITGKTEEVIKEFNKFEDDYAFTNCSNFVYNYS